MKITTDFFKQMIETVKKDRKKQIIVAGVVLFMVLAIVSCGTKGENKSAWQVYNKVDQFGDTTDKTVLVLENQKGTYSSVKDGSKDAKLEWDMHVVAGGAVDIFLREKGKEVSLSTLDDPLFDEYTITVKDDNGESHNFGAQIVRNSDIYNVLETNIGSLVSVLLTMNKNLKIVISSNKGSYSLGTIKTKGFEELAFKKSLLDEANKLITKGKLEKANTMLEEYSRTYGLVFSVIYDDFDVKEYYYPYYSETVENFYSVIMEEINRLTESGKYEEAEKKLKEAEAYFELEYAITEIDKIQGRYYSEYYDRSSEVNATILLDEANNLIAKEDIEKANTILEECSRKYNWIFYAPSDGFGDLYTYYSETVENFYSVIMEEINRLTESGKYEEAEKKLKEAYAYFENKYSDEIEEIISTYRSEHYDRAMEVIVAVQKGLNEKCLKAHTFGEGYYCSVCGFSHLVGDIGPAGGYIFYDCDADNNTGNEDGLISSECGWRFLEAAPQLLKLYVWGDDGEFGTSTAIGTGKENSEKIVAATENKETAAKACLDYTAHGYDDWFLPSLGELRAFAEAYDGVSRNSWSSSEYFHSRGYTLDGYDSRRDEDMCVWPCRAF